jgi:hypothetical protein
MNDHVEIEPAFDYSFITLSNRSGHLHIPRAALPRVVELLRQLEAECAAQTTSS